MLLLGLTGNIACGKSTVAGLLAARGALVIDADALVHELYADPEFAVRVQGLFAEPVLLGGVVDRQLLGKIVFNDSAAMRRLEALVHPAVAVLRDEKLGEAEKLAVPFVVIEAVKLVEAGHAGRCDVVWCVICQPETQLGRLKEARGLSADQAHARLASQPSLAAKREILKDKPLVLIENDGTLEDLADKVSVSFHNLTTPQPHHQ